MTSSKKSTSGLSPTSLTRSQRPPALRDAGLIIDRLSILALKIFHTRIETHRDTASEAHRLRNAARLAVLEEQARDLAACLDGLVAAIIGGSRRFKLYRQMKIVHTTPTLTPLSIRTPPITNHTATNQRVDLRRRSAYKTGTRTNCKRILAALLTHGQTRNTGDRTEMAQTKIADSQTHEARAAHLGWQHTRKTR